MRNRPLRSPIRREKFVMRGLLRAVDERPPRHRLRVSFLEGGAFSASLRTQPIKLPKQTIECGFLERFSQDSTTVPHSDTSDRSHAVRSLYLDILDWLSPFSLSGATLSTRFESRNKESHESGTEPARSENGVDACLLSTGDPDASRWRIAL